MLSTINNPRNDRSHCDQSPTFDQNNPSGTEKKSDKLRSDSKIFLPPSHLHAHAPPQINQDTTSRNPIGLFKYSTISIGSHIFSATRTPRELSTRDEEASHLHTNDAHWLSQKANLYAPPGWQLCTQKQLPSLPTTSFATRPFPSPFFPVLFRVKPENPSPPKSVNKQYTHLTSRKRRSFKPFLPIPHPLIKTVTILIFILSNCLTFPFASAYTKPSTMSLFNTPPKEATDLSLPSSTDTPLGSTIGAPPTAISRTFYPRVAELLLCFSTHRTCPNLAENLNDAFAMTIPVEDILDPPGTTFANSATVIADITDLMVDNVRRIATQTDSPASIPRLIKSCPLKFRDDTQPSRFIRNSISLDNAFKRLCRKDTKSKDMVLQLLLNPSHLHVDPSRAMNVYNFSIISNVPFKQQAPLLPPAPNAATPTTNPALDPGVLLLVNQLDRNAKMYSAAGTSARTTTAPQHPFVPSNFPQDVQNRYINNLTDYVFPTKTDLTPFLTTSGPAYYYVDPQHVGTSFVARNGTYFVLADQGSGNEKNFRVTANKCSGTSNYELANWYKTFTAHCARFGKYCHPYPCFERNTHPRGFSIGNAANDDVPATFETKILQDSRLIWDLLAYIFSDHKSLLHIVTLNDGKGYEALHGILSLSHPNLIDDPTFLVANRPTQATKTLTEYWKSYNHFLQLRALIENNPTNLSEDYELKHFIHGCKHSSFIENEIRRERHVPRLAYKFEPQNICATIHGYLQLSNSPMRVYERPSYYQSKGNFPKPRRMYDPSSRNSDRPATKSKSIHRMEVDSSDLIPEYDAFDAPYEDTSDAINPDDVECAFNMNVNAIKADFNTANLPCLVCEVVLGKAPPDQHKFEDCKILNDSATLRKQFISFCSTIRKTRKAQERSVKQLISSDATNPDDTHMSTDQNSDDTQPDFRPGQY